MFKNQHLKNKFLKKGYCSFPLLSKQQINSLKDIYNNYKDQHNQSKEKFRGTGWIESVSVREVINTIAAPVMEEALNTHFQGHQILGYNFLIKEKGHESAVPLHQDWTYVNEEEFFSMNIWVALEDITPNNGALFLIPYSHKIFSGYLRPSPSYPIPFEKIKRLLTLFKRSVFLKAGECVCFDNRTIHGSSPNMSDTERLVLVTTIFPVEAKLLHLYIHNYSQPEKVTEYIISNADFFKIKRGEPPVSYIDKRDVETKYPKVSTSDFFFNLRSKFK